KTQAEQIAVAQVATSRVFFTLQAPASTDGANLKLQSQSLTLTPVASSGWFGDVFMSSNIWGQLSANCNRQPRETHEKHPRPAVESVFKTIPPSTQRRPLTRGARTPTND